MNKVRVIGVGSPFGADRLSWDVIELLQQRKELQQVECVSLDRPGMALIEYFKDIDRVILLDAMKAGKSPGEIVDVDVNELVKQKKTCSTHGFGVVEALELAGALGELPMHLQILGMETGSDKDWMPTPDDIGRMLETVLTEMAV